MKNLSSMLVICAILWIFQHMLLNKKCWKETKRYEWCTLLTIQQITVSKKEKTNGRELNRNT